MLARLIRSAAATSLVAGFLVVGLVGEAVADTPPATRQELIDRYVDSRSFLDRVMTSNDAWWKTLGEEAWTQLSDPCAGVGSCMLSPSPGAPPVKSIGTGPEVKSGQARTSKTCSSKWGCLFTGIGTGAALLWTLGLDGGWLDWGQGEQETKSGYIEAPVSWYAGTGTITTSVYLLDTDVMHSAVNVDTAKLRFRCNATANVTFTGASDIVRKDTGQMIHVPWSKTVTCQADGRIIDATFDPSGPTYNLNSNNGTELRRVHLVGAGGPLSRGFYWGQEFIDPNGTVLSRTGCRTPGGSEYVIESLAVSPSVGGVNVAPCNVGDTPIWNEIIHKLPDGTEKSQSVVSLAPPAPVDGMYPACATTACYWTVEVDDQTCAEGMPGCVDWTAHPERARCYFGPYLVNITRCYFLERAYETGDTKIPATSKNMDGKPNTWDGPAPNPTTIPQPSPTASPVPSVTASPSPSSNPSPSASPSSSASPSPEPTPTPPKPTPSPTVTPQPPAPAAGCTSPYALGPVQPEAVIVANEVGPLFDLDTIGGYRDPHTDSFGEHSSGLALDFMVYSDGDKGADIATYLINHAERLGVHWVIWDQRVYNVEKASEGWRLMEDRGNDTQNHRDHVHTLLYDTDGQAVSCGGDPIDSGAGNSACWPSGWSWNPLDWVYRPVVCALKALFVPSGGGDFLGDRAAQLRADFMASPPGEWYRLTSDLGGGIAALEGAGTQTFAELRSEPEYVPTGETYDGAAVMMTMAAPTRWDPGTDSSGLAALKWSTGGGSACQGPGVPLTTLKERMPGIPDKIYPFSACSEGMAQIAEIARAVITAFLGFAVFWTTIRQIGAAFGFNVVTGSGMALGDGTESASRGGRAS